ncbi:Allantoicase [Rhizoctonia solani]|uniref:Allantoicase n=1 Tax=Rhizoctonia solani TaxID=456999 RepID=A0A8H7M6Q5_9AGAM|nr:Allantoicase [Rhizoctonia solani]
MVNCIGVQGIIQTRLRADQGRAGEMEANGYSRSWGTSPFLTRLLIFILLTRPELATKNNENMSYERIPLDQFQDVFGATSTEISSVALGGRAVRWSDEFFAEASNLLKVEPAVSHKGTFKPTGAVFDGWETRRHNSGHDWCIIRLGAPSGYIVGFDIDTAHFSGNEAPAASVQALFVDAREKPQADDARWEEILPKVDLGPSSRHLFRIPQTKEAYTHVKLNMYPDGGIARFRVYGLVAPIFPADVHAPLDLASVFSGARVVFTSDQHFGIGPNLLLPGRGKDMGDGWETRRSRTPGHKDWVIIRLGDSGILEQTEIDTAYFKGNFPESCVMHAICSNEVIPHEPDEEWTCILPRQKLGPHRRHFFQLENVTGRLYTHVKFTIYPDGGVKRVRIIGTRAVGTGTVGAAPGILTKASSGRNDLLTPQPTPLVSQEPSRSTTPVPSSSASASSSSRSRSDSGANAVVLGPTPPPEPETFSAGIPPPAPTPVAAEPSTPTIPALPITPEAFKAYGSVIQAWSDTDAVPRGIRVTSANQGTAHKFHNLALVEQTYPPGAHARTGMSVYRATPPIREGEKAEPGKYWSVKLLERHSYTSQAFIPMGTAGGVRMTGFEEPLPKAGRAYLVIVALNGVDDKPDLSTLRAFVASTAQGISYNMGVWHHPMISLETAIDFCCVETQIGTPDNHLDCEIVERWRQQPPLRSERYKRTATGAMLQTMDSRKRPLSPDGASSSSINSKKRAVTSGSAAASPRQRPNGDLVHDEPKDENLEAFRKEALYRRMRHYARELERTQATADEFEKRKNVCEAGMAAMEACWNQLLDTLRSLVRSEKLPPADERTRELFDLVRRSIDEEEREDDEEDDDDDDDSTDYQIALQDLAASSQSLIAQPTTGKFTAIEVHLLRGRLADAQAESESLKNSLQVAENKLERAKSQTVQAVGSKSSQPNGSVTPSADVKEEPPVEATSSSAVPNGIAIIKNESEWKSLAESRQQLIDEMNSNHQATLVELKQLKVAFAAPTEEMVLGSSAYKLMQEQLSHFKADVEEYKTRWNAARDELDNLKSNQRMMHEEALSKSQATIDELQSTLQKREADCLRLRESRDALTTELSMRRARDNERTNGVAQLKVLLDTRGERITGTKTYCRYVMGLDISSDPEQGMQVQPSYVADLQARLESAHARLQGIDHPGEAELELAKFHKAFGKWQDVFSDPVENIITAKEVELKVANAKCVELDAVGWPRIEFERPLMDSRQAENKLKVFDLLALEDKILKVTTEPRRTNKYFQVMKQGNAGSRVQDHGQEHGRQTALIEKFNQSQNQMNAQLRQINRLYSKKQLIQQLTDRVEEAAREIQAREIRLVTERARAAELEKQRNQADVAAIEHEQGRQGQGRGEKGAG